MPKKTALIIGSGLGGLSLGIRLSAMGFKTIILEKLSYPGGRAIQKTVSVKGLGEFTFDYGPTVLTVPHFIEELFALKKGDLFVEDFPDFSLSSLNDINFDERIQKYSEPKSTCLNENFKNLKKYLNLIKIDPFYRIFFSDGSYFDYGSSVKSTYDQIARLAGMNEAEGYLKFLKDGQQIFKKGFIELGFNYFHTPWDMLKVVPDLLKLDTVRSLFSYVGKYFKSEKMRQVFSFETLLIGGNPTMVPAIYVLVHFVERSWGIYYAMGGTGSLVRGFVKKFQELGGEIIYNQEIVKILGKNQKVFGVLNSQGKQFSADLVVSNADYANTEIKLLKSSLIKKFQITKLTRYSMSLFVLYFGFKKNSQYDDNLRLKHHNIIFGDNYLQELKKIFKTKEVLESGFSQYLHVPTLTDPSLAPRGCHAAYTLICVPNLTNPKNRVWNRMFENDFSNLILNSLDQPGLIKNLKQRLVYKDWISPDYFEKDLNSYAGNAFGVSPTLNQSAYFRPHNRSSRYQNLYYVGANTQPGAGTPSVMMSAKITAKLIFQDFKNQIS